MAPRISSATCLAICLHFLHWSPDSKSLRAFMLAYMRVFPPNLVWLSPLPFRSFHNHCRSGRFIVNFCKWNKNPETFSISTVPLFWDKGHHTQAGRQSLSLRVRTVNCSPPNPLYTVKCPGHTQWIHCCKSKTHLLFVNMSRLWAFSVDEKQADFNPFSLQSLSKRVLFLKWSFLPLILTKASSLKCVYSVHCVY